MMNITQEQLNKIFELASMPEKANLEVTIDEVSEALINIERKILAFSSEIKVEMIDSKKVLIADDLELSIFQLSTVFKKIGISPTVARNKEEAISEIHKQNFDCIIVDLFMPDSSDGMDIIKSAVKRREETGHNIKVVVISGTDNVDLINSCYDEGADFCIQKDTEWHAKLLKYISSAFLSDKNAFFSKFIINDSIVSYSIKRFNEPKIYESMLNNINSSIYAGLKNVLFDLKEIITFDVDNAYIFADIYKICVENGGKFALVNAAPCIKEALSFAFMEEIIMCYNSIEEAVSKITENA